MANALRGQKNYFAAVTEYKRFLFFHNPSDSTAQAWFDMGLCQRNLRNWAAAREAFDTVAFLDSGSLREQARFQSALVQLAEGSPGEAEFEFAALVKFSPDSIVRGKALFFEGVCQIKRYAWEEARASFQHHAQMTGDSMPARLDSLLQQAALFKWRSPETAKQLSTFLPGLGQVYSGSYWEGAYSLTLNGSSIALLAVFLTQGQIVDAALVSILAERFYFGGREKAGQLAARVDEQTYSLAAKQALDEVEIGLGR